MLIHQQNDEEYVKEHGLSFVGQKYTWISIREIDLVG